MRCGGDADCKKYELFQNNPQTKKRSRDQKWLHTATRKNHMRAPDNGMFPAIKGGDLLIGFRLQRNFLKNDVVVYKANGKLQVGRILGQETDVITIDDTGQLLVNGTPQTGEIAFPTYAKKGTKKYPYRVPKGCVFLLGDYRTQTKDSRDYGPIKMEDVKAKVITVLRRREL